MAEVKYDIIKNLGVLSSGTKGWQKEINVIRWNERTPKIDIRDWSPEHARMGKGVTLTREELKQLKGILNALNLDEIEIG